MREVVSDFNLTAVSFSVSFFLPRSENDGWYILLQRDTILLALNAITGGLVCPCEDVVSAERPQVFIPPLNKAAQGSSDFHWKLAD